MHSLRRTGIICGAPDGRGNVLVQIQKEKVLINRKRLSLYIERKELYPGEEYDMDFVFESKETRKKRKQMRKRHVEGPSIEHKGDERYTEDRKGSPGTSPREPYYRKGGLSFPRFVLAALLRRSVICHLFAELVQAGRARSRSIVLRTIVASCHFRSPPSASVPNKLDNHPTLELFFQKVKENT